SALPMCRVSGVLLVPVDSVRTDLTPLTDADIPVVLVDRGIDGAPTDVVATDNLEAGRQAARHLYERGFRSPTVIAGPPALRTTRSEEHTSELQSRFDIVCRLLLDKKKK